MPPNRRKVAAKAREAAKRDAQQPEEPMDSTDIEHGQASVASADGHDSDASADWQEQLDARVQS